MKKVCYIILCIILCLTGCGQTVDLQNLTKTATETLSMAEPDSDELLSYCVENWDAGITPEYQPLIGSFFLAEDTLYYIDKTEGQANRIGVVPLTGHEECIQMILRLEDARIEAMIAAKSETMGDILVLAGKDNYGEPFLAAYTLEGEKLWQQPFGNPEMMIFRLLQDSRGCYYAMCADQILLFDMEGGYQDCVACPQISYTDFYISGEGKVFVTYQDEDYQAYLAELQNQTLIGERKIPGNGYLGTGKDHTILYLHNDRVTSYDPSSQVTTELLNLEEYGLADYQVQAIKEYASGELILISWKTYSYDSPIHILRISEALPGQRAEVEKKTITFLTMGDDSRLYRDIVIEFNQQSKDYKVVLEEISLDGISKWSDMYERINTRLLAAESADLIEFMDYRDMEQYIQKGYLEDLTPYISQSPNIRQEDFLEPVVQCFSRGDAIYSIPYDFRIETLMGRTSELGEKPGWTVTEYLDWIAQHPDAAAKDGLSKENVLNTCLMGNLDEYLNRENSKCDFEEDSFKNLLYRISELQADSSQHWDDWTKILEEKRPVLEQVSEISLTNCVFKENDYGDTLVYKGYPSVNGSPCYFYSATGLSILSRSTCKEGAYSFWEYFLTYKSRDYTEYYTEKETFAKSLDYVSSLQYLYDETGHIFGYMEQNTDENTENAVMISEELLDKQLTMIEHAQKDTLENQNIRNIILEEASYYFEGVKNLDDTCHVIQNRVSLYLAETNH